MATISQNLQILIDTKNDIKDAIEEKGVDLTNVPFTDYYLKIAEIQSGGGEIVDTAINILLGHTLPIATKNGGETFFLEHNSGVTITGLNDYATIEGNGTQRVEWTLMENGDTDLIIPYVITLGNGDNVIGRQFYYGKETSDWVTLATLYRPNIGEAGNFIDNWLIIESGSEPVFSSDTTLYNGVYSYQVVSVRASKTATSAGNNFMENCYSFNQPLDLSNLTDAGNSFMSSCYSFNQPLDLSNVTNLNDYFMSSCYSFNQPLDLSKVTSVSYFMGRCCSFNQPLDLSNLTDAGNSFMSSCYSFNQPLDLSNVTNFNGYFMENCYSFNQPLNLSKAKSTYSPKFMSSCYSFNQPLDLSSLASVGNNFMSNCYSFNQPLDLSSLASVGNNFMSNCYTLTDLEWNCGVYPTDDNSLAQSNNTKTSASGTGIKITGVNAQGLINALPDRTSSPYRKLILGGE